MPSEPSAELLAQVAAQTLEDAAFVFTEVADAPQPFPGDVIEARLVYSGAHAGELVLAAAQELAATIAANLLGEDEGGADVTGDDLDAVGEILNMVAGTLALELFGPDGRCGLSIPQVERVPGKDHLRSLAKASAVAVLVDEEGRRIDLSVRPLAGAPA